MAQFLNRLPTILTDTDVVIELRDARLPLSSVNGNFETAITKWRKDRVHLKRPAEHLVVLNKRDLVAEWGMKPFVESMSTLYSGRQFLFTSFRKQKDINHLLDQLVSFARKHTVSAPELNVLVVGMPNVGKSTLLNALRHKGIAGPTSNAFRTSPQPGYTRSLSTRIKLWQDPPVYAFDTPGVMLPFLGRGEKAEELGVKLALIAGIKESLYDADALAAYLVYRLNVLNPQEPVYLSVLDPGSSPTDDPVLFLEALAGRLGMLMRGAVPDVMRAARWFIEWWREGGAQANSSQMPSLLQGEHIRVTETQTVGWGFDFEWNLTPGTANVSILELMSDVIQAHARQLVVDEAGGAFLSSTQQKKRLREEELAKRAARCSSR